MFRATWKINEYIPWRKIKGMRNEIAHGYEGNQLNIVWDVLLDFLPELVRDINNLLNVDKTEDNDYY